MDRIESWLRAAGHMAEATVATSKAATIVALAGRTRGARDAGNGIDCVWAYPDPPVGLLEYPSSTGVLRPISDWASEMHLVGTHKVSYQSIRRLTIESFSLSTSVYSLLRHADYLDKDGRTASLCEELISDKFLSLAIALRTKFYQGADHRRTSGFLESCGILHKIDGLTESGPHPFTLKDVCNKIIHAESVHISLDSDWQAELIEFCGKQRVGKCEQDWMLALSVPALCKGILGWLDTTADR